MSRVQTLAQIGLGGANVVVEFDTPDGLQRAVQHLTTCHPHHFAVIRDGLTQSQSGAVLCSGSASICLAKANLL